MRAFQLHEPDTLAEAMSLLDEHVDEDTHLIAGGTSLLVLMNLGLVNPASLISLRRVPDLQGIRSTEGGGLEIGPLATHRQLEVSPLVSAYCPALATTFGHVATIRIRNQGTIGGNLAHADPAQDPPPMLIALGAELTLTSRRGQRRLALDDFFVDYLTTVMEPGEIVTAIHLPGIAAGTRAAYYKFLPRTVDDYATVSVAAALQLDADGRCTNLRLALGSVAGIPLRIRAVEDVLRGEVLSDATIADAAALVPALVNPPDDARGSASYKRQMAQVWTERVLRQLRSDVSPSIH